MNENRLNIEQINKYVIALNSLISAIVGGMFGLANTIIVITIFTAVSTNYFMNFYIGGFMMILGVMLLVRVCKRRGMTTTLANSASFGAESETN